MLKNFLFYSLFIFPLLHHAQSNEWVWMHGANGGLGAGVYGTKGAPTAAATPGHRCEPAEWKDTAGYFWIFGGYSINGFYTNDLWKYDPHTSSSTFNQWTWMSGDNTPYIAGVYGTQGVSSISNKPGARGWTMSAWTDKNNNLWLFGGGIAGFGGTSYNDLWKYNTVTNEWTWMNGANTSNQPGTYGTKGVPANGNTPGARTETASSWVDNNGNLWLYGGLGFDINGNFGNLDDLWMYNISNNEWMWVGGDNIINQNAVYGTKGVTLATNKPGARNVYECWTDKNGNFWMFGALGYDGNGHRGRLNDMWMYNPGSNMWTWMNGSDTINEPSVYGATCTPSPANIPGSRTEGKTKWKDDCGNLWVFGGCYDTTDVGSLNLNDIWKYNITTNEWVWIKGDSVINQNGVYGTRLVPDPANKPSSRMGHTGWSNEDGFWLFGGASWTTVDSYNDLWKYIPEKPSANFTPDVTSGCPPLQVSFTNNSISNCNEIKSYSWNFSDTSSGSNNTSSLINPLHTFNSSGTYSVTLIVTSCTGNKDTVLKTIEVNGTSSGITGNLSICLGDSTTLSVSGGTGYVWSTGATTASIKVFPTATSTYSVYFSDGACFIVDSATVVLNLLPSANAGPDNIICSGETVLLSASGGSTYLWNTGAVTATTMVSPTIYTIYTVTVSNGNCIDTDNVSISVLTTPVAIASSDITIEQGQTIQLSASGGGSYLWSPASGLSCATCPDPIASPDSTTLYVVTVTDASGCTSTDTLIVTVELVCKEIFVPNAFSPNEDGHNNEFKIYGSCIKTMSLRIYNRWGEKVFETENPSLGWDGIYNGHFMSSGMFVYSFETTLNNGKNITKRGNISLIR